MNQLSSTMYCAQKGYRIKPNADLRQAILSRVYLRLADLEGANLENANLEGSNLDSAYLAGANLVGANLQGANLESAILLDADLRGANFKGANLDAYLTRERIPIDLVTLKNYLYRGDLKGLELTGLIIKGGKTYYSYLERAFNRGVLVKDTNLTGAKYDKFTQWPTDQSFNPAEAGAILVN